MDCHMLGKQATRLSLDIAVLVKGNQIKPRSLAAMFANIQRHSVSVQVPQSTRPKRHQTLFPLSGTTRAPYLKTLELQTRLPSNQQRCAKFRSVACQTGSQKALDGKRPTNSSPKPLLSEDQAIQPHPSILTKIAASFGESLLVGYTSFIENTVVQVVEILKLDQLLRKWTPQLELWCSKLTGRSFFQGWFLCLEADHSTRSTMYCAKYYKGEYSIISLGIFGLG